MARKNILEEKIENAKAEGFIVFRYVMGKYAPDTPQSNLYHVLQEFRRKYPDLTPVVLVGGRRWRWSEGYKMAVVYKPCKGTHVL